MRTKRFLLSLLGLGVMLFSLFATGGSAAAQGGGTAIANGLQSPRGVAVGPDGSVYVAEAGMGGAQVDKNDQGELHRGNSGQITKIAPDGTSSVVVRGLPSQASDSGDGPEVTGIEGLIWGGGYLWGVTSIILGPTPNPGEGALLKIDPNAGTFTVVADLAAYEIAHNPDPNAVDSDPYGLALGPDGMVYVADAAGNDVLKVDPNNGAVSLVAVIPGIGLPPAMQQPGGNPERGGKQEIDPVPTGIDFGPDGAAYVSLLSGGPFPEGAAKIERVGMDGSVSDAVSGLTMLTDVKHGADGAWYVVSFGLFDLTSNPPGFKPNSGSVWRITASGAREEVAGGLFFPNKLAFDAAGNMYVSVGSVTPVGQVLKFNNVIGGSSPAPGMPTTGQEIPYADFAIVGLLLLALGAALRLTALRFATVRR